MSSSTHSLVWDLPTRLFHWLLAGGFIAAATVAFAMDDDGPLFGYHAIFGLIIAFMVVLRVIYGFVGSRYARFSSFVYGPVALVRYVRDATFGTAKSYAGHNPGTVYAAIAMFFIVLGLATTGIMLGQGNESVEEVHEFLAYAMVAVVAAHIVGILLHTIRRRENIAAGMIHGNKKVAPEEAISSSRPIAAVILLVLVGIWAWGLFSSYDAATQQVKIPFLGTQIQVGESENGGMEGGNGGEDGDHDRD